MARSREFNNQRRDSDGEEYLDMHVEHITKGFLFLMFHVVHRREFATVKKNLSQIVS